MLVRNHYGKIMLMNFQPKSKSSDLLVVDTQIVLDCQVIVKAYISCGAIRYNDLLD